MNLQFQSPYSLPTSSQDRATTRNKPKFCVKILQLLTLTSQNRKLIPSAGIAWCDDGNRFICNSQILGNYLNLKSNSINTNFRAHHFAIENASIEDIQKLYPDLPDIKNWKVRRNTTYVFNHQTTEKDAEGIPCADKTTHSLSLSSASADTIIPQTLTQFIKLDKSTQTAIELDMGKLDFSTNWKTKFLSQIVEDWKLIHQFNPNPNYHFASYDFKVPAIKLIQFLIHHSESPLEQWQKDVVFQNLSSYFQYSLTCSQSNNDISILEFLQLCLRFGMAKRIAQHIIEVSRPTSGTGDMSNICFAPWFIPSDNQLYATNYLSNNHLEWGVKLSRSKPNTFSILQKTDHGFNSSHITFNPMPLNEEYLSIQVENGDKLHSSNWNTFLTTILHLKMPVVGITSPDAQKVQTVPISHIVENAKMKKEEEEEPTFFNFNNTSEMYSSDFFSFMNSQNLNFMD